MKGEYSITRSSYPTDKWRKREHISLPLLRSFEHFNSIKYALRKDGPILQGDL